MKDPAILFYFQDFLVGTEFMTDDEVGKYMRILCHLADKGSLSKNQLERICKGEIPETVMEKLKQNGDGKYYQERMKIEKEKRERHIEHQRENANKRWNKDVCRGNAVAMPLLNENENENENINRDLNGFKKKEECEKKKDFKIQPKKPNYEIAFDKALKEMNIQLPEGFNELILEWLKYKAEKRQPYKQTGIKNLIIKLINDSGGNYNAAKNMIFYSVSNNYAGLFKEKANGTGKTIAPATDIEIADILLKHFGDE